MAKYLDLTGLSHYDQKIKQYISQHSGGSNIYKHSLILSIVTADSTPKRYYAFADIYSSSNSPITDIAQIPKTMCVCNDGDSYGFGYIEYDGNILILCGVLIFGTNETPTTVLVDDDYGASPSSETILSDTITQL